MIIITVLTLHMYRNDWLKQIYLATQLTSCDARYIPSPHPLGGSKGGTVVRALASHQCGAGLNPGVDAICGLSLLLVLSLAPRGFSPGTLVFPSP